MSYGAHMICVYSKRAIELLIIHSEGSWGENAMKHFICSLVPV